MFLTATELERAYRKRDIVGWSEFNNPGMAREQFSLMADLGFIQRGLHISGRTRDAAGKKSFLYQVCRKVLGQDTQNYPQEIGDCVSFGAKNAVEYLQCSDILLRNKREKWRPIFAPYFYGTGRVYVGGGQLGNQDGSMGSWMAAAVQKYGALFADEPNVPKYSGRVAKAYGDPDPRPDLDKWLPTAKNFPVRATAQINSWADLVEAVANGYPCPTASDIGYNMEASADGFHRYTTNWSHQMCFIGVDDNDRDPYALILNNWGDCHGHLKDFATGEDLPVGVLRVRRQDAERHIAAGETYAYSNFDGFPEQLLDKALFSLM